MPSYKTHSIHGELVYDKMHLDVSKEDMKLFCMGPDALIAINYKLFELQHEKNTCKFFYRLLYTIKSNNLQNNKKVMAYLYGMIDHFILDLVTHPYIYYLTEEMPSKNTLDMHALLEHWIDDYVSEKYEKPLKKYYKKTSFKDRKLKDTIDIVYERVFEVFGMGSKYFRGVKSIIIYDRVLRGNGLLAKLMVKLNIGDVRHSSDTSRVLPYLNHEKDIWCNPETGIISNKSFDELFDEATNLAIKTIKEVNSYLYEDKEIYDCILFKDLSYNTGIPCKYGQEFKYIKKYML